MPAAHWFAFWITLLVVASCNHHHEGIPTCSSVAPYRAELKSGGSGQFGYSDPSGYVTGSERSYGLPSNAPSPYGYSEPSRPSWSPTSTDRGYYDRYYDYNYRPAVGDHYVRGYYRRDGTYVQGHRRTNRDDSFWNNYSSLGNVNPYTGRVGTATPSYSGYSGGTTYVNGYYRKDGTYVRGHTRRTR